MSQNKELAVKSLLVAVGRAISGFSVLAIAALIARNLPVEASGEYFSVFIVISLASVIGQIGLNQTSVRLIAENIALGRREAAQRFASVVAGLGLVSAFLTFVCYLTVAFFAGVKLNITINGIDGKAVFCGLWAAGLVMQLLLAEAFRGFGRIGWATVFGGALSSVMTIFALAVYFEYSSEPTLYDVYKITAFSAIVVAILSLTTLCRHINCYPTLRSVSTWKLEKTLPPVLAVNVLVYMLNSCGQWVISLSGDAADMAHFGAVSRVAQVLTFVNSLLYAVLPPIVVGLIACNKKDDLENVVRKAATANFFAMAPAGFLIILFPGFFLVKLFGELYADAADALIALSVGIFFNIATGMRGQLLILAGHERIQLFITFISLLVSFALCWLVKDAFGVVGVACAVSIGIIIQCIFEMIAVKKNLAITTSLSLSPRRLKNWFL